MRKVFLLIVIEKKERNALTQIGQNGQMNMMKQKKAHHFDTRNLELRTTWSTAVYQIRTEKIARTEYASFRI